MSTRARTWTAFWIVIGLIATTEAGAVTTVCGDVDGSGQVVASDGLLVLECPSICSTTTTTTTTMPGTANCTNNGNCSDDDCVCSDCDSDLFCSNPANCINNGACQTFLEGCVCADCTTHPECLDN